MKSLIGYQWEIDDSKGHAVQLAEPSNRFVLHRTKGGLACTVTGKAGSLLPAAGNWRYGHFIDNGVEHEISLCTVQFGDHPHDFLMVCPNKHEVFGKILPHGQSMTVCDVVKLLSQGMSAFNKLNHDGTYHSSN